MQRMSCSFCAWLQNLMREYMRNNDRALSNIEALPGGFNALRQLYENVQVSCSMPWLGLATHRTVAPSKLVFV
jgi:hypothetical protein